MKILTLVAAAIILSLPVSGVVAMNGQADRFNEAESYPETTAEKVARERVTNK